MTAKIVLDEQVTFVTDPVSPSAGEEFYGLLAGENIGDEDSTNTRTYLIWTIKDRATAKNCAAIHCQSASQRCVR